MIHTCMISSMRALYVPYVRCMMQKCTMCLFHAFVGMIYARIRGIYRHTHIHTHTCKKESKNKLPSLRLLEFWFHFFNAYSDLSRLYGYRRWKLYKKIWGESRMHVLERESRRKKKSQNRCMLAWCVDMHGLRVIDNIIWWFSSTYCAPDCVCMCNKIRSHARCWAIFIFTRKNVGFQNRYVEKNWLQL